MSSLPVMPQPSSSPPSACPATDPWWSACRLTESAANWMTHGLGLVLALIGAPILVWLAHRVGNSGHVAACAVYGATLIMLYLASTRYHLHQSKPGEYRRLITDHICIYYLIAGTYTAICMTVLREQGNWGWGMLAAVWTLAAAGTWFKLKFGLRYEKVSLAFYVAMGWLALFSLGPLMLSTPACALWLIVAGGVFYTGGTIFYARVWIGKIRYSHAVWHLAVVAGSVLHWFAVRECLLAVSQ
jgi:hemolysin III